MLRRETKLRFRRMFRRRRRQALEIGSATEDTFDRYVFRRLMRLVQVRRFVLGWTGLIIVLIVGVMLQGRALSSYYTRDVPIPGGTYREGIVGTFTNANPLYAQSDVDASASRLVFAGLFSHDTKGNLVPDLAQSYDIDSTETQYTVHLKKDLKWQDGQALTAKDVAFTFAMIKNPESKSYLAPSWRGVDVTANDDTTVTFKLSNALSGFPQSLTVGIIPEHILKDVQPSDLRSSSFNNQNPVGSGPFTFQAIELDNRVDRSESRLAFQANPLYHFGRPDLDRLVIRTYKSDTDLTEAFKNSEVDAMAGLQEVPDDMDRTKIRAYGIPLAGEVMVFFKNSNPVLADPIVRKALVLGINKKEALGTLHHPVLSVSEPLLRSHIGYDKKYSQITNKQDQAIKLLDAAGWKKDPATGMRRKGNQQLTFRLFSATSSEFTAVSADLQKQWREMGVEVEVVLQSEQELQTSVSGHNYDALMYGILLGADPDVYPFWHSTQSDVRSSTRLNLSEYKSKVADLALEAGRTRSDVKNRAIKYRPFLAAWQKDNPALALYQPQFLYITNEQLSGFEYGIAQNSSDRYISVNHWKIRHGKQKI